MSYALEWFTTCFVTASPGTLANAVVDLLMAGLEDTMLKVGLAVLDVLNSQKHGAEVNNRNNKNKKNKKVDDSDDAAYSGLSALGGGGEY